MTVNKAAFAAAVFCLLAGSQADAHARLVSASPAINASAPAPRQIVLKFSEKLEPRFSSFEVTRGGARVPMKTAAVGGDRRTLMGAPAKPLARGAYQVAWHVVAADTHRMQGTYTFTVR